MSDDNSVDREYLTMAHNELTVLRSHLYNLAQKIPKHCSSDYCSGAFWVRDSCTDHVIEALYSVDHLLGLN